jgi:cyclophilin family peptidyl-prolyl cis-trans isomerase
MPLAKMSLSKRMWIYLAVAIVLLIIFFIFYNYCGGKEWIQERTQQVKAQRALDEIKEDMVSEIAGPPPPPTESAQRLSTHEQIGNTSLYPYFDITIGGEPAGRVVMELFDENLPRTCRNFRTLCVKRAINSANADDEPDYKGTPFHRVIPGFMIQGGDTTNGDGTGGMSIFGRRFEDEGFEYRHNQEGLLSMANAGPNTNGSQFFITTKPAPHLDGKHVVFGIVLKGYDVIKRIERLETDGGDRPLQPVIIADCGLMEAE